MPVTFENLWNNHPTISGEGKPCQTNGKPNFTNQCAIRMGRTLALSGVDTAALGIAHCWHHGKSEGHTLRAQELAEALSQVRVSGISPRETVVSTNFQCDLSGKRGIIFFKDYWVRSRGQQLEAWENRSGDHIDLWNGKRLTDWQSWLGISCIFGFVAGDQDLSKEIWFWPVQ